jgi:hypothetical protein
MGGFYLYLFSFVVAPLLATITIYPADAVSWVPIQSTITGCKVHELHLALAVTDSWINV